MFPSTKNNHTSWATTITSHLNTLVAFKSQKMTKMLISSSFYETFFDIWPGLIGCWAAGMLPKMSNLSFESGWNFTQSFKRSGDLRKLKTDHFHARNDDFDHPRADVFISCGPRWPPRSAPEVSPKRLGQKLQLETKFMEVHPFPTFPEIKT